MAHRVSQHRSAPRSMTMVPAAALLLALLACTATGEDAAEGDTICDKANCGKGRCSEMPGLIPFTTSYKCTCDPGWSQAIEILSFSPCIIPHCSFDPACFNLSLALPKGIPITDPCVAINCGPGECKKDEGFSYHCECQPGYVNLLNITALPCVKNCVFGMDCSRMGINPPSPPPAPPGSHDSSGPTAPPSGTKGSVSVQSLLHLLLLVSLAMVQVI